MIDNVMNKILQMRDNLSFIMYELMRDGYPDKHLISYFNEVIGTKRSLHTYLKRLSAIQNVVRGLEDKKVLDIGCGFGFRTFGLSAFNCSVTGVDTDEERVETAKLFVERLKLYNVRILHMNGYNIDYDDNNFDMAMADEMLHHVDAPIEIVKEMHRILKPGGIGVVTDHNRLSVFSEFVRFIKFRNDREQLFSAREIESLLQMSGFRDTVQKHTIFTLPFTKAPENILKLNYKIEDFIEKNDILNKQCGVYVVAGAKP